MAHVKVDINYALLIWPRDSAGFTIADAAKK